LYTNVTVLAPSTAPRVLHDPELHALRVDTVADSCHRVVLRNEAIL